MAKDLLQVVKTKKTDLLFLALFIRLLKPGGRAAVIVPGGMVFGSSNAHKSLRRRLIEDQKLAGVMSLRSGVFTPYAGVSTAILPVRGPRPVPFSAPDRLNSQRDRNDGGDSEGNR